MFYNMYFNAFGTHTDVTSKCKISGDIIATSGTGNQSIIAFSRYDAMLLGATAWYPESKTYELYLTADLPDESIMLTRRDDAGTYFTETYDRMSEYSVTFQHGTEFDFTKASTHSNIAMLATKSTPTSFPCVTSYENVNSISGTLSFTSDFKTGVTKVNSTPYATPRKIRGSVYSDTTNITLTYSGNSTESIVPGSINPALNPNPFGDGSLIAAFPLDVNANDIVGNYSAIGYEQSSFIYGGYNSFYTYPVAFTIPMIITRAATKTIVLTVQWYAYNAAHFTLLNIPGLLYVTLYNNVVYLYNVSGTTWTSSTFTQTNSYLYTQQIAITISSSGNDKLFTECQLRLNKAIGTPTTQNDQYLTIAESRGTSTHEIVVKDLMIFNRELTVGELGELWRTSRYNSSINIPTILKGIKQTSTEISLIGSALQNNLIANFPLIGNIGNTLGYSTDYASIGGMSLYNDYVKFDGSTGALISNRFLVHLDADDATTITTATGVSVWEDKSGSGNNAVQATGSLQPTRVTNQINGRAIIRFDNTDDYLRFLKVPMSEVVSIFLIMKSTDVQYIVFTDGATTGYALIGRQSGTAEYDVNGLNSGAYKYFIDGTAPSALISRTDVYNALNNRTALVAMIGVSLSGWPNFQISGYASWLAGMDIGEIIIIPGVASTTVRQGIEGYLANRWGTTGALPASHPYKSSAPTDTIDKIINPVGIDESNIDIYIRFKPYEYKAQCLYKSGNSHNGMAIGLTSGNILTVYSRSADVLTSSAFTTVCGYNWYRFVLNNDTMTLYDDTNTSVETKAHGLTFVDSPESESIGAEIGGSVIAGTMGNTNFSSAYISDLTICGKNTIVQNVNPCTQAISVWSGDLELPVEIVKSDIQNNELVIWTKIPTVASGIDTIISVKNILGTKMGLTGSENAQRVWDANYVGVYHMIPDSSKLIDSSANHYDGTLSGINSNNFVSDSTGYTLTLSGTEYAKVIYPLLQGSQRASVSTYFSAAEIADGKRIFDLALEDSANSSQQFMLQFDSSSQLTAALYDSSTLIGDVTSAALTTASGYFITTNYNGKAQAGGMELLVDNVSIDTATTSDTRIATTSGILHIGKNAYSNDYFSGSISEILISDKNRSADWDKLVGLSVKGLLGNYSFSSTTSSITTIGYGGSVNGQPWKQQYVSNLTQFSTELTWSTGATLATDSGGKHCVAVTKDRVYLLGSYGTTNIQTAVINSDGTLGAWSNVGTIDSRRDYAAVVVTKGYVYVLGGKNVSTVLATTIKAPINLDGTIGSWSAGTDLPTAYYRCSPVITSSRIYLIGGVNGSDNWPAGTYNAPIDLQTGEIGTWTFTGAYVGTYDSDVVVTRSKVWRIGGMGDNTTAWAPINSDGTITLTWTAGPTLPYTMDRTTSFVTHNAVYLIGSCSSWDATRAVQRYTVEDDGSLSNRVQNTNMLPLARAHGAVFATNSRLYYVGGYPNQTPGATNTVYYTAISGGSNDYVTAAPTQTTTTTAGKLDLTIPSGTVSTDQKDIPIMLRLTNPIGGSSLDTTDLFKDIKRDYATFTGTSNIKTRKFGLKRDGISDLHHSALLVQSPGIFYENNGAMSFSALTGSSIDITNNIRRQFLAESLTVSLWVFPTILNATETYLFGTSGSNEFSISINSTGVVLVRHTSTLFTSTHYVTPYTWNNIVVVRDTLLKMVYIYQGNNLCFSGSYSTIPALTSTSIYIGSTTFSGKISNIQVWNKVCTTNECSDIYKFSSKEVYKGNIVTSILNKNKLLLNESLASLVSQDTVATTYNIYNNGHPWRQQYSFNIAQSTDITGWASTTSLYEAVSSSSVIITKNRVYLLGGATGTYTAAVRVAPINEDGTLGTWGTDTSLPGTLAHSSHIVTKNRVYLLGGYSTSGGYSAVVYTALINEDGTLGTWTTGSLPGTLGYSQAVVTKNRVYLCGGFNGGMLSTVYTAPINEDGTLGVWVPTTSLPVALYLSSVVVTKNRVYLCGGYSTSAVSTVYTAPINDDGTLGTWTTGTSLPVALYASSAVVTNGRIYMLGGILTGGTSTAAVYTAPINGDGTIGTWTIGTSLPGILSASSVIVTNSSIYLLGGTSVATVYKANFAGGKNSYVSDAYSQTLCQDTVSAYYALSSDNNTYKSYNTSWNSIVSSTPAVHGHSEPLPYFYDPDNSVWVYDGISTESALSKAMQIPSNRMSAATLNLLSNFSDVFDSLTGDINLAVSLYSDGVRNVKLTDIKLNNKNYWISDDYRLSNYCTAITSANVYVQQIAGDSYYPSIKVYCLVTGDTQWYECTNNTIPNMTVGMSTTNKYAQFRCVWDLSTCPSPMDVAIEVVIY